MSAPTHADWGAAAARGKVEDLIERSKVIGPRADALPSADTRVDWQAGLVRSNRGTAVGDARNVLQALRSAPELRDLVQFNEFALTTEITRSPQWRVAEPGERWTDDDDTALLAWLQTAGIAVRGKAVVADCVALVAKDHRVHPVRAYLNPLEWDKRPRLREWLVTYLGAEGNADYLAAVGRCWLISAVARVMQPGCKADYVIVFESPQGVGKSMTAASLAVAPGWFADSVGDLRNKDSAIQLAGKWIIELAELSSTRRAEIEVVKAYLSRTHDTYRPPYGRRAESVPRQCVFIGTTNERQYLRDRTGNRRYWPVRCTVIDLTALIRDRDQLWAEAVAAYRAGEQWYLSPDADRLATSEQEDRVRRTEIETLVAEFLDERAALGVTEVTTREVFVSALKFDRGSDSYAEKTRRIGTAVSDAIEAAGWERSRRVGRERLTCYRKP